MPIAAQSIIRRCVETLQDNTSIRWPVNELVRYLNDGQREVVLHRPDAMVTNQTMTCVAGSRQTLPATGAKLIEVVRNATGTRRAVRMVNREVLDAQSPNWHSLPGAAEVLHFMYDARDPRMFYVYPPALATTQLDLVFAAFPTDIAEPADGSLYTAVTGNISLPDIYGNVIQDYILYRAYSKDADYAGNGQRAQAHYTLFANALGIELRGTLAVAPNPTGNPNQPQRAVG
ncbi:MAG: hypothetical protein B7Z13_04770 [Caulobacterales bacterium 32-67-6]|nr:MAG: hypothetical protein B7Z13_04770 [Caulobacterales bacterium 32-67-6]